MTTTFRADVTAGVVAVLQAQQAATPDKLRAVYSSRPGSFPELPAAYIGNADERITYSGQLRTRTMVGMTAVLVDVYADSIESGDRLDVLVDLLVERFTAAYAQVSGGGSILALSSVSDTEVEVSGVNGPILYRGVILGFGESFITEGRT